MKICLLVLMPAWLVTLVSFGQLKEPADTTAGYDLLEDFVTIKLDVDSDYDRFQIRGDGFEYDIQPNFGLAKTLSISYQFLYASISYLPPFLWSTDANRKGRSEGLGYGFGLSKKHFIHHVSLARARGFYLANTSDYQSNWNDQSDPYIQFPDLRLSSIRGRTMYRLNPNFSFNAIHTQTERQLHSAHTGMLATSYHYYRIDNRGASSTSSQRSDNFELVITGGYYATAVHRKKFYASVGVEAGGGLYRTYLLTRLPAGEIKTELGNGLVRGSVNVGLGFNAQRWVFGSEFIGFRTFARQYREVEMTFTRVSYQIFVCYRVKAPQFVQHSFEKISHSFR